jgi:hypothetical protein
MEEISSVTTMMGDSKAQTSMIHDALVAYSGYGYHATIKLYCKNIQLLVIPERRIDFHNALRAYQQRVP